MELTIGTLCSESSEIVERLRDLAELSLPSADICLHLKKVTHGILSFFEKQCQRQQYQEEIIEVGAEVKTEAKVKIEVGVNTTTKP